MPHLATTNCSYLLLGPLIAGPRHLYSQCQLLSTLSHKECCLASLVCLPIADWDCLLYKDMEGSIRHHEGVKPVKFIINPCPLGTNAIRSKEANTCRNVATTGVLCLSYKPKNQILCFLWTGFYCCISRPYVSPNKSLSNQISITCPQQSRVLSFK